MSRDNIRLLTVAVAVSVPQDEAAFDMLQQDFIEGFEAYYASKVQVLRRAGERVTPFYLVELIHYTIKELPIRQPNCPSLSSLLDPVKQVEITNRFLHKSIEEMLTSLAKRNCVRNNIRQLMHSKDNRNTHAAIESTKLDAIVNDFLVMFKESCAANFQFTGTFMEFVMHCYTHYYYPGHARDIWASLTATDFAKREAETNITSVKVMRETRTDKVPVRHLLENIRNANSKMFDHSGQTAQVKGICYDIFYMCMVSRCRELTAEINKKLTGFQLKFIDERDHKESRPGYPENKGVASKVANSRMFMPLFDIIREGNWSPENIAELRDRCFQLGKKDRDGKNCIWVDIADKAETSRYLDTAASAENLKAFETLFKGMISVYSLMNIFEERGWSVIDKYDECLEAVIFTPALARDIDYVDAFGFTDDAMELLEEAKSVAPNSELRNFEQMEHDIAGSEQNNHNNIKQNRRRAETYGLLSDKAVEKQVGKFLTFFSQLHSVTEYMSAVPRAYDEYVLAVVTDEKLPMHYAPAVIIDSDDVVAGKYHTLYYNKFFSSNPDLAAYYLYGISSQQKTLSSLEWGLGSTLVPAVQCNYVVTAENGMQGIVSTFCMFVPLVETFIVYPMNEMDDPEAKLLCRNYYELQEEINGAIYNGTRNAALSPVFAEVPRGIFSPFLRGSTDEERNAALSKSIGFDSFLGIENLYSPETVRHYKNIEVYHKYRSYMDRYSQWMDTISRLQFSLSELLYVMMSFGLFLSRCSLSAITGQMERQGRILIESLLRSEFTEENLQWFFDYLAGELKRGKLLKVDLTWGSVPQNLVDFVETDLSILDYIYEVPENKYSKDSLMYELLQVLRDCATPAQRFIQIHNFLNIKLGFIRLLRDAFELTFGAVNNELSTWGCELNARFNIANALTSARDNVGSTGAYDIKYATLDSIPMESMLNFIGQTRLSNWTSYSELCEDVLKYFKACRQDLIDLVDYNVASTTTMHSAFVWWGNAFFTLRIYDDPLVQDVLRDLRARAMQDDAGFFMCRNSYFKGFSGGNEYYVHTTGRVLEVRGSHVAELKFDFSNESDRKLYETIIRDGISRNVW